MRFSYTMVNSFMACEYQYYLRYIKKVQLQETAASVFGTAVHKAIHLGYVNDLPRDAWIKLFKTEWITANAQANISYTVNNEYIKKLDKGQEMLGTYYDNFVKGIKAPKELEYRFGFSGGGLPIGNHTLIGVIDQIDDRKRVIDYKTGVKPTQLQLDFDLQFTMYSYAYRKLFGEPESSLILRHLGTMKDLVTTRTEKDFEMLAGELDKLEKKMRSGVYVRHLGRDCSRCFFLEHCLDKTRKLEPWMR